MRGQPGRADGIAKAPRDVVGLGRCVWDHLVMVDYVPEWDDPKASVARRIAFSGGGPVATAMATLGRLGADAGYVGAVGDDDAGNQIQAAFAADHVDLAHLRVESGYRSRTTVVLVQATTGKRSFLAYPGNITDIQLEERERPYFTGAHFLHLDGEHPAAALTAATWVREAGGTVVYDAGFLTPGLPQMLPLVDILITNRSFPSLYMETKDLAQSAQRLLALGPRLVVSTVSEDGCWCFSCHDQVHVPGFAVPVTDTTGAGDAFHGAFIFGLLQGWDTVRTATFANAVAAMKCTGLGGRAALPRLDEALAFLREQNR
jgi:sulfofructose kinase